MGGASAATRLRALGRGTLFLLAALLPFERIEPLAHLGPLQLSSVELFLYLALAAWGASLCARFWAGERDVWRRLRGAPRAHRAVALFALVVFASALLAPQSRGAALKFALRSAGGMLLYAAAADLLRAPGAVAWTARALVGGALVAALLVVGETHVTALVAALRPFHIQTFEALGQPRASGPFQYPNIGAMYLEAVAPLAVALAVAAAGRPLGIPTPPWTQRRGARRGAIVLASLILFVLLDAVLGTASRAGLAGAIIVVAAIGLGYARDAASRGPALAALAVVAVVTALASGSALAGRFRFWKDGGWYRAVITPVSAAPERARWLAPSGQATETLELRNAGALTWQREAPTPVRLSYHWLDQAGRVVVFDGVRTVLPTDVAPGGRVQVRAAVRAPRVPGVYTLWWDLVHEHTSWFSERGNPGLREAVVVTGAAPDRGPGEGTPVAGLGAQAAAAGGVGDPAAGALIRADDGAVRMPRSTLWRGAVAAWRSRPLLGIGPDNFRHLAGAFVHRSDTDPRMHANSLYFETLADLGLLGLLAFGGVIVALAGTARRAVEAPATRPLALGVVAGLVAYLLHGVLDYFLEFTPTYALFWLLAGMIVAMQRDPEAAR
jgi:hypothetical protein